MWEVIFYNLIGKYLCLYWISDQENPKRSKTSHTEILRIYSNMYRSTNNTHERIMSIRISLKPPKRNYIKVSNLKITMDELPRDLQLRVVRLLDIDTRRELGIYSKLRVPFGLEKMISKTYIRQLTTTIVVELQPIESLWIIIPPTTHVNTRLTIKYCLANLAPHPRYNTQCIRILHILRSYISSMNDISEGFVINIGTGVDNNLYIGLGEPDGDDSMMVILPEWMTPQHMLLFHMC